MLKDLFHRFGCCSDKEKDKDADKVFDTERHNINTKKTG